MWEMPTDSILKIAIAIIIGAILGGEREYHSKSAGFRTLMMITLGATLFTIMSGIIEPSGAGRIAANIVVGIGFLGAGAIFKDDTRVNGLTTAAAIWAAAALGLCVGQGQFMLAFIGAIAVLVVLSGLVFIERYIDSRHRVRRYRLVCTDTQLSLTTFEALFKQHHLEYERGNHAHTGHQLIGQWILTGADVNHELLIRDLLADPRIAEFDF